MLDKSELKKKMLSLTEDELEQALKKYELFLASAQLDRTEPIESDEQAQAETAADLAEAFDDNAHDTQEKMDRLAQIDFGPKDEVSVGAVIRMGDKHLVVAVSTAEFKCGGRPYMGISPAAPIYAALEGKRTGESCEFNGRLIQVDDVY